MSRLGLVFRTVGVLMVIPVLIATYDMIVNKNPTAINGIIGGSFAGVFLIIVGRMLHKGLPNE